MDDLEFPVHPTSKLAMATRDLVAITDAVRQSTTKLQAAGSFSRPQAIARAKQVRQHYDQIKVRHSSLNMSYDRIRAKIEEVKQHHGTMASPVDEEHMRAWERELQELIGPQE